MLNPYYVTGFVDGEGSFSVTVSVRPKLHWGIEIRPSFSISQNRKSRSILFQIKEFFNCGYIRPSRKDNTYKYEVRSLKDLTTKIIPHFESYPLRTQKRKNFEKFKKIVLLMGENKHLQREGLKRILSLLEEINPASKKVYNRKEIERLMKV